MWIVFSSLGCPFLLNFDALFDKGVVSCTSQKKKRVFQTMCTSVYDVVKLKYVSINPAIVKTNVQPVVTFFTLFY
jgi:hypothetical protein